MMSHYLDDLIRLFMVVYIVCSQIVTINSKSSILWKLNADSGQINAFDEENSPEATKEIDEIYDTDKDFSIITGFTRLQRAQLANRRARAYANNSDDHSLECFPVPLSYYDDLIGVASRHDHTSPPDSEAAVAFFLKNVETDAVYLFDMDMLEGQLLRAKKALPNNAKVYNQLANYWRIKGETVKSIDCFRSALMIDPVNPDALHDLGRLLYSLQYYEDAIFLVRRALDAQTTIHGRWRLYFTLGEIYRAYGRAQQSIMYFQLALELNPYHEPILTALKNLRLNMKPTGGKEKYTIFIILGLVAVVMIGLIISGILSMRSTNYAGERCEQKPRHFNRAMKHFKGFVPRSKGRKAF